MFKENIDKVKSLIVKKDIKEKKKMENLIFFLVLLVVTLIVINFIFKDDKKENIPKETNDMIVQVSSDETVSYKSDLEENLKSILSKIKGVGNVEVLITYNQSSKVIPMYNETSTQSITEENDSNGGTRKIESYDSNKEVISDSNSVPITERVVMPQIEGAIIIAQGAENTAVKNSIVSAVEAATGLSSHKIQVFEMKTN